MVGGSARLGSTEKLTSWPVTAPDAIERARFFLKSFLEALT